MKRYQLKFVLRGFSPMIWSRLFLVGQTSLAQLHQFIQIVYQWDSDHLHHLPIGGAPEIPKFAGSSAKPLRVA